MKLSQTPDYYTGQCPNCSNNLVEYLSTGYGLHIFGCPKCFNKFSVKSLENFHKWDELLTPEERDFLASQQLHISGADIQKMTPEDAKNTIQSLIEIYKKVEAESNLGAGI